MYKSKRNNSLNILELDYTKTLKGFCAIGVIIHHYVQKLTEPGMLYPLNFIGILCVGFFFFMSGYGLTQSYNKNKSLSKFWKSRILNLYIPFIVANIIIALISNHLIDSRYSIEEIIITSISMRTIYSNVILWYIFVQVLMYIFFYSLFKLFDGKKTRLIVLSMLCISYILIARRLGIGEWRYNTVICFVVGSVVATYIDSIECILREHYIGITSMLAFIFLSTWVCVLNNRYNFLMSNISSIAFVLLMMSLSYKVTLNSMIFKFLGELSYEIYILQLPIILIINSILEDYNIAIVVICCLTVATSFITSKISKQLYKLLSL